MKANLNIVCKVGIQEDVRRFLTDFFQTMDLSDTVINHVVLAIDEAIVNAIIHGHEEDPSKSIELDIDVTDNRIAIDLHDIGLFDIKKDESKSKDIKTIIEERQKGGLGLKLIYSIMDLVCFYSKNDKSHCLMVKLIAAE